jgi:hypothetical protein
VDGKRGWGRIEVAGGREERMRRRNKGGWLVGLAAGYWYGVWNIGDDGCRKIHTVLHNVNDQAGIFSFGDGFGVRRVRIA